jgi:hypothetical protein
VLGESLTAYVLLGFTGLALGCFVIPLSKAARRKTPILALSSAIAAVLCVLYAVTSLYCRSKEKLWSSDTAATIADALPWLGLGRPQCSGRFADRQREVIADALQRPVMEVVYKLEYEHGSIDAPMVSDYLPLYYWGIGLSFWTAFALAYAICFGFRRRLLARFDRNG